MIFLFSNSHNKLRISIYDIFTFLFLIIFILNCKGFYLFLPLKLQSLFSYFYYICTFLSIFFALFIKKSNQEVYQSTLKYNLFLIAFFVIPQFLFTFSKYDQGIFSFFKNIYSYLFVFWTIPILYLFSKKNGYENLLNGMSKILLIGYLLIFINVFLQNTFHFSFFRVEDFAMRNDRIRLLNLSSFMPLVLLYHWNKILDGSKSKMSYILCFVLLVTTFYVEQTRMGILVLLGSMFFMFLFKKRDKSKKILISLFIVAVISFGLFGGYAKSYLSQFSLQNNGISTSARIKELRFFLGEFKSSPLFGIGVISPTSMYQFYNIPSYEIVNAEDIGIFGSFGTLGLGVFLLFIFPMIRWWKVCKAVRHSDKYSTDGLLLTGVYFYLLFSSLTLFILNFQRIALFPFCIALFEYYAYLLKQDIKE